MEGNNRGDQNLECKQGDPVQFVVNEMINKDGMKTQSLQLQMLPR